MPTHPRECGDPAVLWAAHQALRTAGGPNASQLARCKAVFYWLKSHVRFKTDDALIGMLFGEQNQLELLIEPRVMLRSATPTGDCDDFTMLACTLLNELGVPNQIVTVKADQPEPDRWSHVYCCATVNGQRLALDCSHGDFPGWEVPQYYEKRYWDSATGQALTSEAGTVPQPSFEGISGLRAVGLHGLTRRGTPYPVPGRRRGMGDTTCYDADGNAIDCGSGSVVMTSEDPIVVPAPAPTTLPTAVPLPITSPPASTAISPRVRLQRLGRSRFRNS